MKRILITGATGFIGRYVVQELFRRGHHVVASSSGKTSHQGLAWFSKVDWRPLDLAMFDSATNYYSYFDEPDLAIHLAWEGLPNYKQAFHFEKNLPRHYAFLQNLIIHGCKDLTVTGTCFEYGIKEGQLSEWMATEPANAYALAKDCLNKFLLELQKTQPFDLRWIRLFYLYGKGQAATSLFSQLEAALATDQPSFRMSPGLQLRDYLTVEKVAQHICDVALQKRVTGVINCCSGRPVTVKEMVESYLAERGKKIELDLGYYPYPDYEAMAFWGDTTKLQNAIHE